MPERILLLDTGKEWGGGTNSMLELLRRIDRTRFDVTVLHYHNYRRGGGGDLAQSLAGIGVPTVMLEPMCQPVWAKLVKELARGALARSGSRRSKTVFAVDMTWRIGPTARRIAELLRAGRFDMLYANNQPSSNLEGILAAEAAGVPLVQHCRSNAVLNADEVAIANRVVRRFICVSQGVAVRLAEQGIAPELCCVVHNGIDGQQSLPDGSGVRSRLAIGSDVAVAGCVGSLLPRKGLVQLLRAVRDAQRQLSSPLHLMVVGDGPQRQDLTALANDLGLGQNVHFVGFQAQPLPYLAGMDVLCQVSESEGLPRAVLEAMLLAKPVIATDVTGSRELVRDGQTGALVPFGDEPRLAAALALFARDAELRRRLGSRGREIVLAEYGMRRYVEGVETVLAEIAK